MNTVYSFFNSIFNLFFPLTCAICKSQLSAGEEAICLDCLLDLPETDFMQQAENPMALQFIGRVDLERVMALFYFTQGSSVQKLIHDIKYRKNQLAAHYVGELIGRKINADYKQTLDLLLPIPLHDIRMSERGFNQTEIIAQGINSITGININSTLLKRQKHGDSQTSKSRDARISELEQNFALTNQDIAGKHILLVDDVVTSGATIEVCARLLAQKGAKVSVASIAWTRSH